MFKSFPDKQYNCLLSMFSWRRNISSCCIHAILHWIFYIIQILSCVMSLMYHMQEKCTKNQLNRENVRLHQRTGSRCYIAQAHVVVRNETIMCMITILETMFLFQDNSSLLFAIILEERYIQRCRAHLNWSIQELPLWQKNGFTESVQKAIVSDCLLLFLLYIKYTSIIPCKKHLLLSFC
jgi:hypothetical protein